MVATLAFSLDSVAAAVDVTGSFALEIAGGVIRVNAGDLAVALVGSRLLLRLEYLDLEFSEWSLLVAVGALFAWVSPAACPKRFLPATLSPEP